MKKLILVSMLFVLSAACHTAKHQQHDKEWIDLFDGKSLDGWKASEHPETFTVENGMIVVHGQRAHLFYTGTEMNHDFKDFELQAKVMTTAGSNSGIFIHTQYQETGWPSKGYEIQVNNSHTDWRRTGSLYGVEDVKEAYVKDDEWYTEAITVKGKRIIIKINDKTVVDYTEPDNVTQLPDRTLKHLSNGTFALQGHDPKSKVFFKEVKVKVL